MKQILYIITHASIDEDTGDARTIGAYTSFESAVKKMQNAIYAEFEENKEWWEDDDEGGEYIEEQYQEWIEEQFTNDERTIWTYTNDDPIEHTFQIHTASVDFMAEVQEAYAVLHTCIDGVNNQTELIGAYATQNEADLVVKDYQDDGAFENILSISRFSIDVQCLRSTSCFVEMSEEKILSY